MLLTYWNTASFLTLYAGAAGWEPGAAPVAEVADRPLLDRWALSELHRTVAEVDAALEDFDTARAGRRLAAFIDDLSNWYVRRSRRRFWDGDPAALATLHECLDGADPAAGAVHAVRHRGGAPGAGHPGLAGRCPTRCTCATGRGRPGRRPGTTRCWPSRSALVRRLVELGRSARTASKVRTRQPLAPGAGRRGARLGGAAARSCGAEVADELNVQSVEALGSAGGELVDVTVKPNFRALGKRFGSRHQAVAAAVAAADPAALAGARPGRRHGHGDRGRRAGAAGSRTTWSSPRRRGRAGRWPRTAARPSRWT